MNSPFVAVHARYFAGRPAIGPVAAPGESEYAGSVCISCSVVCLGEIIGRKRRGEGDGRTIQGKGGIVRIRVADECEPESWRDCRL